MPVGDNRKIQAKLLSGLVGNTRNLQRSRNATQRTRVSHLARYQSKRNYFSIEYKNQEKEQLLSTDKIGDQKISNYKIDFHHELNKYWKFKTRYNYRIFQETEPQSGYLTYGEIIFRLKIYPYTTASAITTQTRSSICISKAWTERCSPPATKAKTSITISSSVAIFCPSPNCKSNTQTTAPKLNQKSSLFNSNCQKTSKLVFY